MDLDIPQPQQLLEKVRVETDKSIKWQMAVELGRMAREQIEGMQWLMGDMALIIENEWGKDALEEYAAAVGVKRNTLLRYALVSVAFPPETREPKLSHRHHLILAARTDRFDVLDKIKDRDDVSSENLTRLLKKQDGKIDGDIAAIRVLVSAEDLKRTINWYGLIEKVLGDHLKEADHILCERYRQNLMKLKHLVQNGHSEDL